MNTDVRHPNLSVTRRRFPTMVLAGIVALLVTTACSGAEIEHVLFQDAARTVAMDLGEGNFDQVSGRFNDNMSTKLPPSELEAFWDQSIADFGDYGGIPSAVTSTTIDGLAVVEVPVAFDRAVMKLRVTFEPDGAVAGLYLLDPQAPLPVGNKDHLLIGLVLLLGGLIVSVAGWFGWKGRLPRNGMLGIRVPSTMRSDEAWKTAHVAAGLWIILSGVPMIAVGVMTLATAQTDDVLTLGAAIAALVLVLIGGIVGVRAARSVANEPTLDQK